MHKYQSTGLSSRLPTLLQPAVLLYNFIQTIKDTKISFLQSSLASTHSNFTLKVPFPSPTVSSRLGLSSLDSKLITGAADVQVQGRLSNISLPEPALHTSIPPCTCSWNQLFFLEYCLFKHCGSKFSFHKIIIIIFPQSKTKTPISHKLSIMVYKTVVI